MTSGAAELGLLLGVSLLVCVGESKEDIFEATLVCAAFGREPTGSRCPWQQLTADKQ